MTEVVGTYTFGDIRIGQEAIHFRETSQISAYDIHSPYSAYCGIVVMWDNSTNLYTVQGNLFKTNMLAVDEDNEEVIYEKYITDLKKMQNLNDTIIHNLQVRNKESWKCHRGWNTKQKVGYGIIERIFSYLYTGQTELKVFSSNNLVMELKNCP